MTDLKQQTHENSYQTKTHIENLRSNWLEAERVLSQLAQVEDDALASDKPIEENLDGLVCEQFKLQTQIIGELASTEAGTLEDICMKLEVWDAQKFGANAKHQALTPTEKLVRQAIKELNDIKSEIKAKI